MLWVRLHELLRPDSSRTQAFCFKAQGTFVAPMSASVASPSSPAESDKTNEIQSFCWETTSPDHGEETFVRALQCLGIEMSKAVPDRIKQEAITPMGVEPTSDLLTGRFVRTTKERQLQPGCTV